MPIYEYQCETCQKQVELLISADETPVCPKCDGTKLTKQFSVTAAPKAQSGQSRMPMMPSGGG